MRFQHQLSYPPVESRRHLRKKYLMTDLDHSKCLLDDFKQFVEKDPDVLPSTLHICQQVLRFIAKQDRRHECEEFCGIWRFEYKQLASFIDSYNFCLKPRLTYFDDNNTLIVEIPSQVHKAPLTPLNTALTCLFESIPYEHQAVNVNVMDNIEASDSLVPDLRISFQNMRHNAAQVIITGIAETAFSQHLEALEDTLEDVINANPNLLLVVAAVVYEQTAYRSPKKNSDTARTLLRDTPKMSKEEFIAATGVLPTLDAPVVVANHTWCSISSIRFKVWVRGSHPIDIYSDDPNLVADGVMFLTRFKAHV